MHYLESMDYQNSSCHSSVASKKDWEDQGAVSAICSIAAADRFALSCDAMERLKIDSFAAMAKALPDVRPQILERARRHQLSQSVVAHVAKRIADDL